MMHSSCALTPCCAMQDNVISWRLRDVPELGYHVTDKPYPRGELLVKTKATVPGYFKHEKVEIPVLCRLLTCRCRACMHT